MDRTKQFLKLLPQAPRDSRRPSDSSTLQNDSAFRAAKHARAALLASLDTLKHARDHAEAEKEVSSILIQAWDVIDMLNGIAEEGNREFISGIVAVIRTASQAAEIQLEGKRYALRKTTLNVALEPEKAPTQVRPPPVLMQMLKKENARILKRMQYSEREVTQVRRKISEIDSLQRLISQEIFSQDERIDMVLAKSTSSAINVKISKTYIKNANARIRSSKRFVSLFILIFSLVILLLHLGR